MYRDVENERSLAAVSYWWSLAREALWISSNAATIFWIIDMYIICCSLLMFVLFTFITCYYHTSHEKVGSSQLRLWPFGVACIFPSSVKPCQTSQGSELLLLIDVDWCGLCIISQQCWSNLPKDPRTSRAIASDPSLVEDVGFRLSHHGQVAIAPGKASPGASSSNGSMPVCPNYGEACWAMSGLCWARVGPMLGHVEPKFSNLADLRPLKKKKKTWKNTGFYEPWRDPTPFTRTYASRAIKCSSKLNPVHACTHTKRLSTFGAGGFRHSTVPPSGPY